MRIVIIIFCGLLGMTLANAADMVLKSTAYSNGQTIPKLYSCDGKNISPQLSWTNVPPNTQSFVLILSSPDWPQGTINKWVLFNMPADMTGMKEADSNDLPETITSGENDLGDSVYHGPCPPDDKPHKYIFTLYALDTKINLPEHSEVDEVLLKIKRRIIQKAELMGIFKH